MTRVVFTGPEESLPGLEEAARKAGFPLERRPLISFEPPADWTPLDAALANLDRFGAIALTSPRAAGAVAARLNVPCSVPAWVTGSATAAASGGRFTAVHITRASGSGDAAAAVADAILASGISAPVLFPCGDRRRDSLVTRLEAAGLPVITVVCYRSVLAERDQARACGRDAAVLIASSPSVALLLARSIDPSRRPLLAALGRTTAVEARDAGWPPDAVALGPTADSVIAAVAAIARPAAYRS